MPYAHSCAHTGILIPRPVISCILPAAPWFSVLIKITDKYGYNPPYDCYIAKTVP
jgi:hypothetical protein